MKGRASTKGRQGRRRRDAKKQLAAIPEVLDVFVQLPSGEKVSDAARSSAMPMPSHR